MITITQKELCHGLNEHTQPKFYYLLRVSNQKEDAMLKRFEMFVVTKKIIYLMDGYLNFHKKYHCLKVELNITDKLQTHK